MEKRSLVCLICCKEFKGGLDEEELGRKEENVESLKQFCEVILEEGDGDGLNDKLSKFLNNPNDNLSICGGCLDLIKIVTEARLSAKCVEESVGKLQVQLLRELRRLQGRLDLFWGEFRKMEENLVNGDSKLIGNNLDGSYSEVNDGERRKRGKSGKISEEHTERKQEIFGFREKICQVFRDFHQFNKNLNDKITCNPISQPSKIATPKKIVDTHGSTPKKKRKLIKKSTDKQPCSSLSSSAPKLVPKIDEIRHDKDEDDNDVNMDDEPMHLDNFDDNDDDFSEDNPVKARPADKRASLRRHNARKKYEQEPSDSDKDDDAGEDDSEDYKPEVIKTSKQVETKRCQGKVKKQDKQKPSNFNQHEEDPNLSEDNDEEFKPQEDPANISVRARIYRLLREYEPHLAKLSPFKRNLIRSVLKCQCFNENHQKKKGADKLNVFQRHMTYISYNVETQLISLKDIPIKVLCQEGEDGENGLLCMKCDFKVDESSKMENLMWEHVLSKHLNAYQCPHCKKQYETYYKYNMHVYQCLKRKEKVGKVDCDICGKSLCNKRSLQMHKWSHMNEQERKIALETGLVKNAPINNLKRESAEEKIFQCEQCGKSFSQKKSLEKHEMTHQDRDSREQFICAKCGKSFLKSGYEYHLKYDLTCGQDDPNVKKETCTKCGKILRNKVLLKRHMKWVHSTDGEDLKIFICGVCGKGFRRSEGLKLHENTHTGEKPWSCGKCGGAFSRQSNMKRHEATCAKYN